MSLFPGAAGTDGIGESASPPALKGLHTRDHRRLRFDCSTNEVNDFIDQVIEFIVQLRKFIVEPRKLIDDLRDLIDEPRKLTVELPKLIDELQRLIVELHDLINELEEFIVQFGKFIDDVRDFIVYLGDLDGETAMRTTGLRNYKKGSGSNSWEMNLTPFFQAATAAVARSSVPFRLVHSFN